MLHAPTQQHLSRRASSTRRDAVDRAVREVASGPEGAVGLGHDAPRSSCLNERASVFERADLHLVHYWSNVRHRRQLVQLRNTEVRDADRTRIAEFKGP